MTDLKGNSLIIVCFKLRNTGTTNKKKKRAYIGQCEGHFEPRLLN